MKLTRQYSYYMYFIGGAILLAVIIILFSTIDSEKFEQNTDSNVIYLAGHISNAHQLLIDKFNKKQNGRIVVKSVDISFLKFNTDEHKELFARFLRSESDKVDVFLIDQIWVSRFAKWSEPLENYISYEERRNIVSQGLEACSDGERLVGVPLYVDIALMYYRDDLLQKSKNYPVIKKQLENSITWEDFLKYGEEFKNSGTPYYVFQAKAFEGLMCSFIELLASQNMTLYRNSKLQLNTPEARKALTLLVNFVNRYKLSPKEVADFEERQSYEYFIKNDGLFLRGWPNLDWHYNEGSQEEIKTTKLVKTLPPHFKGGKKSFVLGGWNMMISKFSNNKKFAVEFIKYLLSEEAQKILYEVGNFIPSNVRLYDDPEYTALHPDLLFFKQLLEMGFHRPFLKDYTKISGIITSYINLAVANKISVEEALLMAEEKINSDYFLAR